MTYRQKKKVLCTRGTYLSSFFLGMLLLYMGLWPHQAHAQTNDSSKWDLERILQYATTNNITVKQQELNKETASITYSQSKVSRLPSISASASQSITKGSSIDPITSDFVSETIRSSSASLSAQLPLYQGNELSHTIKQNHLLLEQSSLTVEEAKNSIEMDVTQAYLQALYYHEGIDIAKKNMEASQKQLDRTQALYEVGSAAKTDLADIQSQYATDKYTMVTSQNAYDQQVLTLKQLLELEPRQTFELAFPEIDDDLNIEIPDKFVVYEHALEIMPEVESARLQKNIDSLNLKIARSGYQPSLYLTGSLSTGYTNTQDYSFSDQLDNNFNQSLGLSLSIPIFNQFATRASVQKAKVNLMKTDLDMTSTQKELYANIENAHQNAVAAKSEMEAAKVNMDAAQTAYDLAQQQYEVGQIDPTDLIVSQNAYLVAQQQYLQTKYTTILYYQLLQFYQGNPIALN